MIFINRKRINNAGKDTSKFWYVEKYVYGVLKETVEIPLGTSTTFSAINSDNSSDTFYGWSVSSTSTTRTFTNTTSYSNTTTNVKNNLDENNTLKIYAVYSYSTTEISENTITSSRDGTTINVAKMGTAVFGGYHLHVEAASGASFGSVTLSSANAKIDSYVVTGTVWDYGPDNTGTTVSETVQAGDTIWIKTIHTSSGKAYDDDIVTCTVPHYVAVTKYRV